MSSEHDNSEEELVQASFEALESAGDRLRAQRKLKGLELEHVAAETRIPIRHLETIETGTYENLPSRTYAIGFARNYAKTVGLDEKEITDLVRQELAEGHGRESALAGGMEPGDAAKVPSRGLAWAAMAAAVLLAVGGFAFYNTYFAAGSGPGSLFAASEDSDAEELAAAETDDENAADQGAALTATGPVVFTALEDGIWVRFYEDEGERLFESTMASGDTFEVPGDAQTPLINTGRPDAFAITINGQSVPKLAEEPITLGDTPISAEALLARANPGASDEPQVN